MRTSIATTLLGLAAICTSSFAVAQDWPTDPTGSEFPAYSMYTNPDTGAFIKPIIAVAGGIEHQEAVNPSREQASKIDFGDRITTFAVARFGFEGRARRDIAFKLELQRDPGAYGTGTWEGTSSLSAREMWASYERWGTSVAAGIIQDPASIDYFSAHASDTLVTDVYSRNPLLHSGFNRGQGILLQFKLDHYVRSLPFVAGLSFSSSNPLASSASYPFGGNISSIGDLNRIPRGAMTDGNPGSPNTEMQLVTPSLSFHKKFSRNLALDIHSAIQVYRVYVDKSDSANESLMGRNIRGGVQVKLFKDRLAVFGNGSLRENNLYASNNGTGVFDYKRISGDRFKAYTVSGGLDYFYDDLAGIGGSYSVYGTEIYGTKRRFDYINIGASGYLSDELTVGLRRAYLLTSTEGEADDGTSDQASWFLSLRLVI